MNKVMASFKAVNAGKLAPAIPAINGLLSTAPKQAMPMMVVSQSSEPAKTSAKVGTALSVSMLALSIFLLTQLVLGIAGLSMKFRAATYF